MAKIILSSAIEIAANPLYKSKYLPKSFVLRFQFSLPFQDTILFRLLQIVPCTVFSNNGWLHFSGTWTKIYLPLSPI
jgi:hypothetical protein